MELTFGLLLIRFVVGALFVGHGAQKLFGWFSGDGIHGTGEFFESLGYKHGPFLAVLAGIAEMAGGLSLAVGFLTPVGAAILVAVMVNAIFAAHWNSGLWAQHGGFEYPLVMLTLAIAFAVAGPGRASVDAALGLELYGWAWAAIAVMTGAVASFAAIGTEGTVTAEQ